MEKGQINIIKIAGYEQEAWVMKNILTILNYNLTLIFSKYVQIYTRLKIDVEYIEKELNKQLKKVWIPFPKVVIDELIIKFKGRYKYVCVCVCACDCVWCVCGGCVCVYVRVCEKNA